MSFFPAAHPQERALDDVVDDDVSSVHENSALGLPNGAQGCPTTDSDAALQQQQPKIVAERYKVNMCRSWERKGYCSFTYRCMFAHGDNDLRTVDKNIADGIVSEEAIFEHQQVLRAELIELGLIKPPSEKSKKKKRGGARGGNKAMPANDATEVAHDVTKNQAAESVLRQLADGSRGRASSGVYAHDPYKGSVLGSPVETPKIAAATATPAQSFVSRFQQQQLQQQRCVVAAVPPIAALALHGAASLGGSQDVSIASTPLPSPYHGPQRQYHQFVSPPPMMMSAQLSATTTTTGHPLASSMYGNSTHGRGSLSLSPPSCCKSLPGGHSCPQPHTYTMEHCGHCGAVVNGAEGCTVWQGMTPMQASILPDTPTLGRSANASEAAGFLGSSAHAHGSSSLSSSAFGFHHLDSAAISRLPSATPTPRNTPVPMRFSLPDDWLAAEL